MKNIVTNLFLQYGFKYQLEEIKEIAETEEFKNLYDAIKYFEELEEE